PIFRLLLRSSFFRNDTATTEIYTLSLHDALPILSNDGTSTYHQLYEMRITKTSNTILEITHNVMLTWSNNVSSITNQGDARLYRSEEHTSELQSRENLVCRLLLEKKKRNKNASEF